MAILLEESRVETLLDVVVAAINGNYDKRIPLAEREDRFLEAETGVNYLLDELVERRNQNQSQRDALVANARQLADQQQALFEALSTPILAVWPGVLALPIIGQVDDERASKITEKVLARVAESRATHILIDLTGLTSLSARTLPALLQMVNAIHLLGAACMLTGIGPEVAQQAANQGLDVARLRVAGRLSDALALVLKEKGALRR